MDLIKLKLDKKVGSYCFIQNLGNAVILSFPPPHQCYNDESTVKYTRFNKLGFPGKITQVGNESFEVKYFGSSGGGYGGISSETISFSSLQIREMN